MILRSTKELVYDSRDNKTGIIALKITDWVRSALNDRFTGTVEDYIVRDTGTTTVGEPLKSYEKIASKPIYRTNQEVNDLFNYVATPIEIGDNFNEKIDYIIVQGLMIDTQIAPVYGSAPEDWEIVDETLEVYVEPIV